MSSPIKKVAIVGATGNMGKHTIDELLKSDNHTITALTRKGRKLSLPSNVNVIEVDYTSIEALTTALHGQDFLMITLSVTTPPSVHSNLVSAAAAAGIKYIMPNAYGFNFNSPALIRDIPAASMTQKNLSQIEALGMQHFSLVCSFWYEWSLGVGQLYGINLQEKTATFFDDGKTVINTSTWKQCGRAVARTLSLPLEQLQKYANTSFYVSSFRVSQREMLDSVHRVLGTSDKDWSISYETTKHRYEKGNEDSANGNPMGYAQAMYARVFFPDGSGDYETSRGLDNEVLGLQQEDLDEATRRTVEMVQSGWNPYGPQ
ncbi:NAD(P)-binding protein [Aureobasidium sp. EXF-10727]|nr:NAD(P)-binding protein [Aureobasidium sp. EXF-10727]